MTETNYARGGILRFTVKRTRFYNPRGEIVGYGKWEIRDGHRVLTEFDNRLEALNTAHSAASPVRTVTRQTPTGGIHELHFASRTAGRAFEQSMRQVLDTIGRGRWFVGNEPRPKQNARTIQEFFELPIGTVVNTEDDETLYKIGEDEWTEARYLGNIFLRVLRSSDWLSESAATVVFTPEVQA